MPPRPDLEAFALAMSPHGRVVADPSPPDDSLADAGLIRTLSQGLATDDATALLELGARRPTEALPPSLAFFREVSRTQVAAAAASSAGASEGELEFRALAAPPMLGREYVTGATLHALSRRIAEWDPLESTCRHASLSIL